MKGSNRRASWSRSPPSRWSTRSPCGCASRRPSRRSPRSWPTGPACRSRRRRTRSWARSSAPRRCAWARGSSSSAWPRTASWSSGRRTTSIQRAAKFDRIVFRIIPDDNVRLANLRSGDIDVMHQVAPTDASSLKKEGRFEVSSVTGLGFNSITINLHNKTGKTNPPGDLGTPLANDPRVREALRAVRSTARRSTRWSTTASTRPAAGRSRPTASSSTRRRKCPTRDVARAKKLLADAGLAGGYKLRDGHRQQPAAAAGRRGHPGHGPRGRLRHQRCAPQEFASALKDNDDGKHQAFLIGWSGRVDPDGNIHQGQACGAASTPPLACDEKIDALLNRAREISDVAQRRGALPRGHRPPRRATQHHLPLSPELHRGVSQEPQGLQGRPRRADPDQGHRPGTDPLAAGRVRLPGPAGRRSRSSRCSLISLIVFTGVRMIPGDPARVLAGTDADAAGPRGRSARSTG